MELTKDLREFVDSLSAARVEFVVVGAYARGFYGSPRYTGDIDFFVRPALENGRRIVAALEAFGFASLGLTESDFERDDTIVQLGVPPNRIDLITSIDGVNFDEAWAGKVSGDLGGVEVFFIGRDDYVRNKLAAGRPKDLADAEAVSD